MTVRRVFKFRTGRHVELKGAVQFDIDGVQPPRNAPEFGNLIQIERNCCCRHYFESRLRFIFQLSDLLLPADAGCVHRPRELSSFFPKSLVRTKFAVGWSLMQSLSAGA